jgi:hypothetical protein
MEIYIMKDYEKFDLQEILENASENKKSLEKKSVVMDFANKLETHMETHGAECIGSSFYGTREMEFEYRGKVLEVYVREKELEELEE